MRATRPPTRARRRTSAWLAGAVAVVVALGVCSDDADDTELSAPTTSTADSADSGGTDEAGATTTGSVAPGDPAATTTGSVAPGDPELCAAFTTLGQLDDAVGTASGDFAVLQAAVADLADDVAAVYAQIATLAPDLAADVVLVADFTATSFEVIAGATSLEDVSNQLVALPGAAEAAQAAVRVQTYSQAACGVSITGT